MNSIIENQLINKLYWDRDVDPDYICGLLEGQPEQISGERTDLYRRILNSFDWYTILKIFTHEQLKHDVLNEQVISRLFPKDLRKRYRYARNIL